MPVDIADLSEYPEWIEALAEWHYREWAHVYPRDTQQTFAADLYRSMGQGFVPSTWVLVEDGEVWGSASILDQDMDEADPGDDPFGEDLSPWLASVYVRPERRGSGLGARIVKHLVARASRYGIERVYLFTSDKQAFYERLGWRVLRWRRYHGERVAIMAIDC